MALPRTIIKQDVAAKLFPQSTNPKAALQLLRIEIKRTPNLKKELEKETDSKHKHYFTDKQILIILEHFGYTVEEYQSM